MEQKRPKQSVVKGFKGPLHATALSVKKAFISMRFGQTVHTNTLTVYENALESGSKRNENARLHFVEAMWTVQNGTVNRTPT